MDFKTTINNGRAVLGMELGSTRIKAVLTDETGHVIASGEYSWENRYENNVWTYSEDDILKGIRKAYSSLSGNVKRLYDEDITELGAIGISAMMHGYLAFDEKNNMLVPFRTWRNTITAEAAAVLTEKFNYNIPQRWSVAHLYQAVLNKEEHVSKIKYLTTLSGYVHFLLTDRRVLGVGDASGMFPIDCSEGDYDKNLLKIFNKLPEIKEMPWKLESLLPKVLMAGEEAGTLTAAGAALLDEAGKLKPGAKLCPPEGDAGTGMTATNSIAERTGNISAGTSVFAMVVLENPLSRVYPEIDLVTTPDNSLVGMVHCNNCTSEINAWVKLFAEFSEMMGNKVDMGELFTALYKKAEDGEPDCGGLISYNYFSGEPVTGMDAGAPLFMRDVSGRFSLGNFMRMHLYSALASLKIGLDIMIKEEHVKVDSMLGHGGFFKTEGIGQSIAAAAVGAPVAVMNTAGEGGAWGAALLAGYTLYKEENESLGDYLNRKIFRDMDKKVLEPDEESVKGFDVFIEKYKIGMKAEKAAVDTFYGK